MEEEVLHKIVYGLYVVSSKRRGGKKLNGQIANTVFQVTSNPKMVAICINKDNLTHEFIKGGAFTISILSINTPMKFIGLFGFKSGRDTEKFEGVEYKIGETGMPILIENAIAYLECKVSSSMDVKTHTLFIGRVVDAASIKDEPPMTYAYYHDIKHGLTPKAAPTYIIHHKNSGEPNSKPNG